MSETARLADDVLPASTQFEKAEASFSNFEFPTNAFHPEASGDERVTGDHLIKFRSHG